MVVHLCALACLRRCDLQRCVRVAARCPLSGQLQCNAQWGGRGRTGKVAVVVERQARANVFRTGLGGDAQVCHRAERAERFAPEAERRHGLHVLEVCDFGGVVLGCYCAVVLWADARPVVSHLYELSAVLFQPDLHTPRA